MSTLDDELRGMLGAGAGLDVNAHPSSATIAAEAPNSSTSQNRIKHLIATNGYVIDLIVQNGKTQINIPKTEGMLAAKRAEVAQNLIAQAMIHGVFTMKADANGLEKPHFKIATKDFILRAAMEQQLDILGYTYDKAEPAKLNKEKQDHDNEYSQDMAGILPLLSFVSLGLIPGRLPSRYETAIEDTRKIVRHNNAKSTIEYTEAKSSGDRQVINRLLEDRTTQRAGFFNRFIAGASQTGQNLEAQEALALDFKRRTVTNQTFSANIQDAENFFAAQDNTGCRKAGDKKPDGSYMYLDPAETPSERLDKIAKHGVGEGNGWTKPAAVTTMTGQTFAANTKAGLEAIADRPAARTTARPRMS